MSAPSNQLFGCVHVGVLPCCSPTALARPLPHNPCLPTSTPFRLTTAAHWDATAARSSAARHDAAAGTPPSAASIGVTLRHGVPYPLDAPEESVDPDMPIESAVPPLPQPPYEAPRVAAPTAMPAPPPAAYEPPRGAADDTEADGGGAGRGDQPPLFPPMEPFRSHPTPPPPSPMSLGGGHGGGGHGSGGDGGRHGGGGGRHGGGGGRHGGGGGRHGDGGGRGGGARPPAPLDHPPVFPEPAPAGPCPTEEVVPVPEESIPPEDDDIMMAAAPLARPAAPVNEAPETAVGLEELNAQLRQLRWAQPDGTA